MIKQNLPLKDYTNYKIGGNTRFFLDINSLNDLTDSILYAERIQKAIFPQRQEIHRAFGNSLYLNRPRNIISGDFCFLVSKLKKGEVVYLKFNQN